MAKHFGKGVSELLYEAMRWNLGHCVMLVALWQASPVMGQTYPGNLNLTSQAEVDAFNYTEVTGYLNISGGDITDLSPLFMLRKVGSYLTIHHNSALAVVDGFGSLTNVGSGIFINDNTNMVSVSGFGLLQRTGDNMDFWNNNLLVSISGFESLHTVDWSLEIGGNPSLTSLPGFPSLQTVTSSLFILDNTSLPRVTGFNALQSVGWSFNINGISSLSNLCGFVNYFSANNPYTGGGTFDISDNAPSLPNPTTIQDVLDAGPCPCNVSITAISAPDLDSAVVTWTATSAVNYTLQYSPDLLADPQAWSNVPGLTNVPGPTAAPWTLTGTNTGVLPVQRRYYRVRAAGVP